MEHLKILNLSNEPSDFKLMTKKWNIINDHSNGNYSVGNETIFITEVLQYNLCDYHDAYIVVIWHNIATQRPFRKLAQFTKNNEVTKDDAGDLELVKPMYNLIE